MQEKTIHVPRDLRLLPQFEWLRQSMGELGLTSGEPVALWFRLWERLAYDAASTRFGGIYTQVLRKLLGTYYTGLEDSLIRVLTVGGSGAILIPDADEEGLYLCPKFIDCNGHLSPGYKPSYRVGNEVSAFSKFHRRSQKEINQYLLSVPSRWRGIDGQLLEGDDLRRSVLLVMCLDNILGRSERKTIDMTEGLMATAHQSVKAFTDPELEVIYKNLIRGRGRPECPKTAEEAIGNLSKWRW